MTALTSLLPIIAFIAAIVVAVKRANKQNNNTTVKRVVKTEPVPDSESATAESMSQPYAYHSTFSSEKYEARPAYTESSMGEGFSGEGCEEHYSLRRTEEKAFSKPDSPRYSLRPELLKSEEGLREAFVLMQVFGKYGGRRNSL